MTNYECIKAMSIDEMAERTQGVCRFCKLTEEQTCDNTTCKQGAIQYLESEVEEERQTKRL